MCEVKENCYNLSNGKKINMRKVMKLNENCIVRIDNRYFEEWDIIKNKSITDLCVYEAKKYSKKKVH